MTDIFREKLNKTKKINKIKSTQKEIIDLWTDNNSIEISLFELDVNDEGQLDTVIQILRIIKEAMIKKNQKLLAKYSQLFINCT